MAEEDLLAALEAAPPPTKKKLPIRNILIVLAALLVLGAGGYFGYKFFVLDKKVAEEAKAKEEAEKEKKKAVEAKEEPEVGVMYTLEPFIVNLAGSEGKRFLKATIALELSVPELRPEVKENLQKITDSVLILLSSKTFEDVYSVQGKFKLKDEITTRVNRFLLLGHVKDAYFTEFVVQ
ncbi:MAG: flagellar basal body-associated FliL family protein [Nitrospinae bacterium]|nr:flagellar basal body-associated FliL family protein [Nitrospinota bacterium]